LIQCILKRIGNTSRLIGISSYRLGRGIWPKQNCLNSGFFGEDAGG
jgi:hypothetical protein